jgi:hypothetical protein
MTNLSDRLTSASKKSIQSMHRIASAHERIGKLLLRDIDEVRTADMDDDIYQRKNKDTGKSKLTGGILHGRRG